MLLRRKPKPVAYVIEYGITRAGRVGVGIFCEGRLAGWGVSESAAWAAVQTSAAA